MRLPKEDIKLRKRNKLGVLLPGRLPEKEPKGRPRETYGLEKWLPNWVYDSSQLHLDRYAFAWRVPISQGVPLRPVLFRKLVDAINPNYFEWNDWTDRLVKACCDCGWIAFPGASGSAKTHNIAGFACAWWLCAPNESSVIFCSTTAKSLRKRGWANVQMFYSSIPGPRIGNFVDSRMLWQIEEGDDKHAIAGIAVEEGSTHRVADNIKGIHTRRQMVIIDEATAVPEAIFDACTNLYAFPKDTGGEFILVMLGNPRSRLDQFGRFMEPLHGWNSVTVDDEEWETKEQIDGETGLCVRFDAEKSPNIVNPRPDGQLVSRYLPTKQRVESRKRRPGFENDPTYWSNERGMPPPEGLSKSVFTESALDNGDAYGKHSFTGAHYVVLGALDPARVGGDRPTLRWGVLGEVEGGDWGLEVMPPIVIPLDATSSNPVDFQLTEQVRREAGNISYRGQTIHCTPQNIGVDSTGGGADLVDIMQRMWSPAIMRIGFSESPSKEPVSHEDVRPADTVYRNRRAEMYFRTRHAIDASQLKGLDKETARELCTIEFDDSKPLLLITSKADYKKHHSKSPDLSDSLIILLEVARRRGFHLAVQGQTAHKTEDFSELVASINAANENADHLPEELDYGDDQEVDLDLA